MLYFSYLLGVRKSIFFVICYRFCNVQFKQYRETKRDCKYVILLKRLVQNNNLYDPYKVNA